MDCAPEKENIPALAARVTEIPGSPFCAENVPFSTPIARAEICPSASSAMGMTKFVISNVKSSFGSTSNVASLMIET